MSDILGYIGVVSPVLLKNSFMMFVKETEMFCTRHNVHVVCNSTFGAFLLVKRLNSTHEQP